MGTSSHPGVGFRYTIGLQEAGVVTTVGCDVAGSRLGDRVVVTPAGNRKCGTWIELVAVNQPGVRAMPCPPQ